MVYVFHFFPSTAHMRSQRLKTLHEVLLRLAFLLESYSE